MGTKTSFEKIGNHIYDISKDGLYQVFVNNTILNTILDKKMQNYTILYTNTILNQNKQEQALPPSVIKCY